MQSEKSPRRFSPSFVRGRYVTGLIMEEHAYSASTFMPFHAHDMPHCYLVLEGVCRETNLQSSFDCEPSTLIFHPAREQHALQCSAHGARLFGIELEPQWIRRLGTHGRTLDRPHQFQQGLPTWLALRLYHEFKTDDDLSALSIEALMLELLVATARKEETRSAEKAPGWLQQVRDLLHSRYTESLVLAEIAGAVGIHPTHLARVFRQHFGCTIGEYMRQRRVESAGRQLAASDAPLAHIALETGFSDQSQFSKTFKTYTGMTPSEYRRIARSR
ncbi:MAG TPA: AraC family transcriptional regulator [Chthonomonadaceae bacterium]|nr:AraC family transcriptional regulator [Chthonomonadaceae bacterium]